MKQSKYTPRPGSRSQAGLCLKTGIKVGLAVYAQADPAGDFGTGYTVGAAGVVFDPSALIDLGQRVQDWFVDYRIRQLKHAGKLIDLPDLNRFFELDAARGLAISMMVVKHGLDGWGRVLFPRLSSGLLLAWMPLKLVSIAGICAAIFSSALLESEGFQRGLDRLVPGLTVSQKTGLAWALAAVPALFFGLHGAGAAAFLVLSGMTMAVRALRQVDPQKMQAEFTRQGFRLLGLGLLLTVCSLWLAPQTPVYFGILHLMGLASLLVLPFLSLPVPFVAACGLVISAAGMLISWQLPCWLGLGFVPLALPFADYTPLIPFFGMLLVGLAAGRTLYTDGRTRRYRLPDLARYPCMRALAAIGRHSLLVYLAQEPVYLIGLARAGV